MAEEPKKEKWIQWVALTTTILAVCAAISALKGGGYATKIQIASTQEANAWNFYQAKSIKQHLVEVERDQMNLALAEARTPEGQKLARERLERGTGEAARYDKEKAEIKARAEKLQAEQEEHKRHGGAFGLAVMLLQIAIMLSSVGALIKKPAMWVVGLCFGAAGLAYMANGFFLWL